MYASPVVTSNSLQLAEAPEPAVAALNPFPDEGAEIKRWSLVLGLPFVLSAAFFMAVLATGQQWLIGGALLTGPGLLIMAVIYLSLTSDTDGV